MYNQTAYTLDRKDIILMRLQEWALKMVGTGAETD